MRMNLLVAGAVLATAAAATADVKIDLGSGSYAGNQSISVQTSNLLGTITGFSINMDFVPLGSDSWASDMALVIDGFQWGGYNALFGTTFVSYWGFDGPGSAPAGHYSDVQSGPGTSYDGSHGAKLIFGNGYIQSAGAVYNNVSVVLFGVQKVPAPGALALLGLAGFAGRRRRAS